MQGNIDTAHKTLLLFNLAPAALNNPHSLETDTYARETWLLESSDDGITWDALRNISAQVL